MMNLAYVESDDGCILKITILPGSKVIPTYNNIHHLLTDDKEVLLNNNGKTIILNKEEMYEGIKVINVLYL